MKIHDISQEVFSCKAYQGDPTPQRQVLQQISDGAAYNLTAFQMCAHNGTHVDAPYHFLQEGETVDQVSLNHFIGCAYVAAHEGEISAEDAEAILAKAHAADGEAALRILIKGSATVTEAAADVFAGAGLLLFGNESQTVGPEGAPMSVHRKMLGAKTVLLEGIRLGAVQEGVWFLNAAPLNLGGADGAPCRAILMDINEMRVKV